MRAAGALRAEFEASLPFPLDEFQARAMDAVDRGESVLVAAPTGSGKTVVAEYAVAAVLAAGNKAFYTTPIKALSNQKFQDLRAEHGAGRVGLLTGDNSINGDASVVVMTTEVLRNMIYAGSPALDRLGVVILDEVHYLQDPYRGAVWEEVIIHLDPAVRLVCLSATVSNAEEFGDWLATVRGRTEVVIEERRPVELVHLYGVSLRDVDEMLVLPVFLEERGSLVPNGRAGEFDPVGPSRRDRSGPTRHRRARAVAPRRVDVIDELASREMLPAIYFIFSRAACDDAVTQLLSARVRLNGDGDAEHVRAIAESRCAGLSDADLEALNYGPWLTALEAGIASHHAGMVPPMKEAVEEAFLRGLVKVVFATETLALGINMPARSVVIERLTKFTGERHEFLTPGEYTQLTGRAGRRGIDDVGYGVVLWNRFARFDQIVGLASKRTYELRSSFRPTYNMAVNLVRRYARQEAHHLLNLSFAQYRIDREVVTLERQTDDLQRRLDEVRAAASCERGNVEDYRRLLADRDHAETGRSRDGERVNAVVGLRAGDVVDAGRGVGRVVILQRSSGRGGSPRIMALDQRARIVRLGPTSFRERPRVIGRLRLPEPFRPKSPAFRREVAHRLGRADYAPPRSRRDEVDRTRERGDNGPRGDRRLSRHPVAACPDLGRHLDAARRAERLERDYERVRTRAAGHGGALSRRFDLVLELLDRRGYVRGWNLTDAGECLSRIYTEADLLIAEALREGVFDGLSAPETAAVASVFTYEARGPEEVAVARWPTAEVARRVRRVDDLWSSLREQEAASGLPETRPPDGGFALAAHGWAAGQDLDDILAVEELTGGDFVRNVKQLSDLLRQIADAVANPDTARRAREASDALFRGVVEASSRVGA